MGVCSINFIELIKQWLGSIPYFLLNKDQQWDSQGTRHVIQVYWVAEGQVPAS